MATLTLKNIKKSYPNGYQAIHGVNLDVNDGEMVVLVGPSGCGKSTLLRMIAGLEEITSGSLEIDADEVNRLEPGERDIAMVFQNYALYPHMSVYDNMAYGLKNRRVPKHDIRHRVNETAKLLELENLLDRKPAQLSGGQRQRVAMGRAIVRSPRVFLFDEPLSNLDAKLRVPMRLEIRKLQKSLGTTSVYVTHDQVEAMTLGDKLVVLNKGNIEQIGTPMQIYEKPASLFVATFIGAPAMNILAAKIDERGVWLENQLLNPDPDVSMSGVVSLGIRPEHLTLTQDTPKLKARIQMIESLGADQLLYCELLNSAQTLIVRTAYSDLQRQIGQEVGLDVSAENLHLFDSATGARIEPVQQPHPLAGVA